MIKIKLKLTSKIILSISIIIFLTSLSLTSFLIRNQAILIRDFMQEKCLTITKNLAYKSEYGILTTNIESLQKLTENTIKEQDIIYSIFYNKNGDILIFSEQTRIKGIVDQLKHPLFYFNSSLNNKTDKTDIIESNFASKDGIPVYEVILPIKIQFIQTNINNITPNKLTNNLEIRGFVRVGISLERMNLQLKRLTKGALILTFIVVLAGIVISIFLIQIIVKPIKELSLGIPKIASGNLDYKIEINSDDEIGELANYLNKMAIDLKNYIKELNKEKYVLINLKIALEERTRELEDTLTKMNNIQQELLRSEKFATLGRLSSCVAHELRNPLASLKNISYYLSRVGIFNNDEKAKRMLQMLSLDVERANKIVTDLLDFSRVKKLNKLEINIKGFINSMLDNITFHDNKNVQIVRDLENIDASIDSDKITQVLINLITNARDAMTQGGQIIIASRKIEDFVQILIEDNGSGMDEETANRIFEPLFTTKTKGLGLGLAIVKEIIEAHYGKISVKSEKGKGTIFEILLPL